MDGGYRCLGRVEILYQSSWATICDTNWDKNDANVVCRQLGCGTAISYTYNTLFEPGPQSILLKEPGCMGDETHLWHCPSWSWGQYNCSGLPDAGVVCSGFVRLGGRQGLCSGRVEVHSRRGWLLVSDVNFTFPTAQVICAELRCGKAVSVLGNVSRNASEQMWAEEFQCEGQEPELSLCPRGPCPGGSCQHSKAVEVVCEEITQIRLVDGRHRCEGRVEILLQGFWGTISEAGWDEKAGQVVCSQLGCGEVLSVTLGSYFGPGKGRNVMRMVTCTGEETHMNKCYSFGWVKSFRNYQENAGVICSEFVRLVEGQGLCSGRVEVNLGGSWTPVSAVNFTFPSAQVICAELGCGKAVSIVGGGPFRDYTGRVWTEEFQCEGQEPGLWFCPRAPCPGGSCQDRWTVQIVCSEFTEVRLIKNGTSHCEGQVEVNTSSGWRALCASHWSMTNAKVVCHQLDCGLAVSTPRGGTYFMEGGDDIWKDQFHCSGSESFLWSCPVTAMGVSACAHGNTASVVCSGNQTQLLPQCKDSLSDPAGFTVSEVHAANCSDNRQLRLVDGNGRCAGRVEILHQESWGTICDDSWDLNDAHVVCRQLDCGVALNATVSAHFGQGSGPIWLDELNCTGDESHVWHCPSQGWKQHDCRHKEDAGVICSEFLDLRVVNEDQECSGWLEVFYNGTWGSVCHNPMDDVTLSVICRQLGCGDSGNLNTSVPAREGLRHQWVDGIQCRKTDASLWQCPSEAWDPRSCSPKGEAYITCTGQRPKSCAESESCTDKDKLRLRGGDSQCSGRVEVWHEGSWGTACDDSWDLAEAEVVCQQLGCGHALNALAEAAFGPGNGSIWLDEVQCRGRESSLWDCARAPWGQSDCKHEEDAGVRCSGERTTVPSTPIGNNSFLPPEPGILSLPVILCITLGALILLVLIILGTQLHRCRANLRASSSFEDAVEEALYQEIDYLIKLEKEDLLDKPEQHIDATGNGYDDVEELPALENPLCSEMSEKNLIQEEGGGGSRCSQTGTSLLSPEESSKSVMEVKGSPLVLRQESITEYDDIELNTMSCHF
nr:antigen WC1.1-like [Cavia porcellus]